MKILEVNNLTKYYNDKSSTVIKAVDDVSFSIEKGTVYALLGQSGCGKTTLAKTILKLTEPTSGEVFFEGVDILKMPERNLRKLRPKIQMVFQNPYSSLNPRMKIGSIIKEGIDANKIVPKQETEDFFMKIVGECEINPSLLNSYPDMLSGGERQRVAIARALSLKPEFVIADEIISSLDKEVAKQTLNLVIKLKKNNNISFLYISHDIRSVRYVADYIGVMHFGKIIEQGKAEQILNNPQQEYTKQLLLCNFKGGGFQNYFNI